MLQHISTVFAPSANQRPRREKVFGGGRHVPLDRNAKARIKVFARALTHRTEKGKHWGVLTAKFLEVLDALLFGFHNTATGACFPSYETIMERARCARGTVYSAIHALERAGILTWVNRIVRVREEGPDLFGRAMNRWRVLRTSNSYQFIDPKVPVKPGGSSKSKFQTGTTRQVSKKEAGEQASGASGAVLDLLDQAVTKPRVSFDNFDAALAFSRERKRAV